MRINDYLRNKLKYQQEVFFLDGHLEFAYSDGSGAENYVLNAIQNSKDISSDSRELESHIKDWSSRYHLARERTLAYKALKIEPSATILEVGSGCGSITRFLGERAGWVLALEGSSRRATIARERTRDLANVDVLCASFEDVDFSRKFDIVVCNGVLEYAAMFVKAEEPGQKMLAMLSSLVAPGGSLIVAIENKFGLRYFSSSKEEHTNIMFDGIEGYPANPKGARTYGDIELENMLHACFDSVETFIPLPDYKLPTAIVRDKLLERVNCAELFANTACFDHGSHIRPKMYERLVWAELQKNALLKTFSNSLFMIAGDSTTKLLDPAWMGCIYSIRRKAERAVQTSIFSTKDGVIRTEKHYINSDLSRLASSAFVHHEEQGAWVDGQSVHTAVVRALCNKRMMPLEERLDNPIKTWWSAVEIISDSTGIDKVSGKAIDSNWQNAIVTEGGVVFIDNEWEWNENIDKLWLIYRVVTKFTQDEILFVHRWSNKCKWITNFKIIKVVAGILGVEFSIAKLLKAIEMEIVFQSSISAITLNKARLVLSTVWPVRVRKAKYDALNQVDKVIRKIVNKIGNR